MAFAKKYKPVTRENCIEVFDANFLDKDFCEKCNIPFLGHDDTPHFVCDKIPKVQILFC